MKKKTFIYFDKLNKHIEKSQTSSLFNIYFCSAIYLF